MPTNMMCTKELKGIRLTKRKIRSRILLRLKTQKEETRSTKSQNIEQKLFRSKVFKKAKIVMLYVSFDGEVNTEEMIKKAKKLRKIIALPVCNARTRSITPCILESNMILRKGLYGILEPRVHKPVALNKIDLVVVPGVAFDKKGNRLGRGKGYYDRFLKILPPDIPRIGLAYGFQILPSVPISCTDQPVNRVICA